MSGLSGAIRLRPDVAEALAAGRPVVALESTLIAHGLPRPENRAVARDLERLVRASGAVPATIAVLDGAAVIGLDETQLEQIASRPDVAKLSARDLPLAVAAGVPGATTVASTAWLAARAGIRVFATGGLGGVHRGARKTWDESADLETLSRTPIVVVCAGVKSILDVGATLERLESLGVALAGFRTRCFPGFYLTDSGFPLDWSLESEAQVAAAVRARDALGLQSALIVAHPLPEAEQLDPERHDAALRDGLAELERRNIHGKAVTPFLLDFFGQATGGESRRANIRLVERNVQLAARIAVALSVS